MIAITLDKIANFYAEQKKYDQAQAAAVRANLVRAYFLANGLSVEAAEQVQEGNNDAADALLQRVLQTLDPIDPKAPVSGAFLKEMQELRDSADRFLKDSEKLKQSPAAPPKKPAPVKK